MPVRNPRTSPYSNYNFIVQLGEQGRDGTTDLGGFSEVSGLGTELTVAEYRNGNDPNLRVRKIPGLHSTADVTLKRGILNSTDFWEWIQATRTDSVNAQRDITITLNDESGTNEVESWRLLNCIPLKYMGPQLQGKGGGDVAVEELHISAEGFEFVIPAG